MIYLDYAATTPLLPEVKQAMQKAADRFYGNPSSLHTPGHLAHNELDQARQLLAELINADPEEIIFTSGSTESNNTVINIFREKSIAASEIEHESILTPAQKFGKPFTPVKIDINGKVCYNEDIWLQQPKLISIIHASNELGTIQDLAFWSQKAHKNHAFIHSDMTQSLGKVPLDVKKLGLDYATFSAHKIGGPVGISALYIKKNAPFEPFLLGGNQENRRRAGTENAILAAGFAAALKNIQDQNTPELYAKKVALLRDYLATQILQTIPGASLNTPIDASHILPNILNVSFSAAEGESIQLLLDAENIIVSTGSACAAGNIKPSHVLMAKTHDAEVAHSSIRFSLSPTTTQSELNQVLKSLQKIIQNLQSISTIMYNKIYENHNLRRRCFWPITW